MNDMAVGLAIGCVLGFIFGLALGGTIEETQERRQALNADVGCYDPENGQFIYGKECLEIKRGE
jgi:hypothetical protein